MIDKRNRCKVIAIVLITIIVGYKLSFLTNSLNSRETKGIEIIHDKLFKSSSTSWWNSSFHYRRQINITNPYPQNFINFTTSINFNYTQIVDEGKMQSDLDDIRIVENGVLKKYYFQKDFPIAGNATIWFKTSISASIAEQDTFMYYGNDDVGKDIDLFMENNPDGDLWYDFEEGNGTNVIDSMGNYNGTEFNGPVYDTGMRGNYSLDFDGSNDYVAIQDLYFSNPGEIEEMTALCWFKTNYSGGSYNTNWAFLSYDRSEYFDFYINGQSGAISFSTNPQFGSITDFDGNTTGLNDGNWHFACVVYDGIDKIIYINNGSVLSEDGRNPNVHSGSNLGSGNVRYGFVGDGSEATTFDGNRNNIYYDGTIDGLRFFNYTLSSERIEWIMNDYELHVAFCNEEISGNFTYSDWWNSTWHYRIPVNISANGADQYNAPVELQVNFTQLLTDHGVINPELNNDSIRVIEYMNYQDFNIVQCQFDPWTSYDKKINAIGDVVWIMDGNTSASETRYYYIYFENGTNVNITDPGYEIIRRWHEGFEEIPSILSVQGGQDIHPSSYCINNTISARGDNSLSIWGNCWKAEDIGFLRQIIQGEDTFVTAKMRFDDPGILRETSGIGFSTTYSTLPGSTDCYNIRGSQSWGSAGAFKYRNIYYASNTFFWYTFNLTSEISIGNFQYIIYVADDDSYDNLTLYWDDISIWDQPVQTIPDHMINLIVGNLETLLGDKLTTMDVYLNQVQNSLIGPVLYGELVNITVVYRELPSGNFINESTVNLKNGTTILYSFEEQLIFQQYNLTLNTTDLNIGSNLLTIHAKKDNFSIAEAVITIIVAPPPGPPGNFILYDDAGNPDTDSDFILSWTPAMGAQNYTIYEADSPITLVGGVPICLNGTITIVEEGLTNEMYPIFDHVDGDFYFIVTAFNDYGNTTSNGVNITISKKLVPGYDILIVVTTIGLISLAIYVKRRREHNEL